MLTFGNVPGPPRFSVSTASDKKLGVGLGTRLDTATVRVSVFRWLWSGRVNVSSLFLYVAPDP